MGERETVAALRTTIEVCCFITFKGELHQVYISKLVHRSSGDSTAFVAPEEASSDVT